VNASDQGLWKQLAESVIGRLAAALFAAFTAARDGSRLIARTNDARDAWQSFTPSMQWQFIGTVLLFSVLTHVGLLAFQRPSGYWWWAIPGMAGAFALLLLALAMTAKPTDVAD
jgi:hypothetical protein